MILTWVISSYSVYISKFLTENKRAKKYCIFRKQNTNRATI